jgi:hypothetical protein
MVGFDNYPPHTNFKPITQSEAPELASRVIDAKRNEPKAENELATKYLFISASVCQ